jgi:pilus assembly protein TadC
VIAAGFAGFFAPDLMLERAARRRHRRMVIALPDALDLLSVSVATGRSLGASLSELAVSGRGPLAHELARAGQDMAWGTGQRLALDGLKQRIAGKEIASLTANLERSRKLGSPLADQLRRQGGFIPGVRPGPQTERYLGKAVNRITLPGAVFIAIIAVLPYLLLIMAGVNSFAFAGTAVLISVGVALELMRQIDSQLTLRNYEGFLK